MLHYHDTEEMLVEMLLNCAMQNKEDEMMLLTQDIVILILLMNVVIRKSNNYFLLMKFLYLKHVLVIKGLCMSFALWLMKMLYCGGFHCINSNCLMVGKLLLK
jgi:hypothetical protein